MKKIILIFLTSVFVFSSVHAASDVSLHNFYNEFKKHETKKYKLNYDVVIEDIYTTLVVYDIFSKNRLGKGLFCVPNKHSITFNELYKIIEDTIVADKKTHLLKNVSEDKLLASYMLQGLMIKYPCIEKVEEVYDNVEEVEVISYY